MVEFLNTVQVSCLTLGGGAGDPELTVRVETITSMPIGVIVGRRIIHVNALVEQDRESLISLIAPGVQAVLTTPP